jgi:hypothetical protein
MSGSWKSSWERPIVYQRLGRTVVVLLFLLLAQSFAHASVALLMEEPFGGFGAMNPTGHAAVYLNHVCAASTTELRPCQPGESGVVISRYHKIGGLDWIAIPLIPYLYAVEDVGTVPQSVDQAHVDALRDAYRRKYLLHLAMDDRHDKAPGGEWIQLVGASYDRTIHGFQVVSTPAQDERFIAIFNDRRNVGSFNILFHNCADFSRAVLNLYLPDVIHRSIVADIGMTTPKQVARSLVQYGRKHPELQMSAFVVPQVPGSIKRSKPVKGVAESLLKSKKYLLPLAVLTPELTGGVVVAYLTKGRMELPKNALIFNVDDNQMVPGESRPIPAADSSGDRKRTLDADAKPAPDTAPISDALPTPATSPKPTPDADAVPTKSTAPATAVLPAALSTLP